MQGFKKAGDNPNKKSLGEHAEIVSENDTKTVPDKAVETEVIIMLHFKM